MSVATRIEAFEQHLSHRSEGRILNPYCLDGYTPLSCISIIINPIISSTEFNYQITVSNHNSNLFVNSICLIHPLNISSNQYQYCRKKDFFNIYTNYSQMLCYTHYTNKNLNFTYVVDSKILAILAIDNRFLEYFYKMRLMGYDPDYRIFKLYLHSDLSESDISNYEIALKRFLKIRSNKNIEDYIEVEYLNLDNFATEHSSKKMTINELKLKNKIDADNGVELIKLETELSCWQ